MHAIISDIHGNLEALDAVLADAQACGATDIYCLGDIVGFGPDPIACVQRAMSWPVVLMGNFDQAAISYSDLIGWTAHAAKKTILQFRRLLKQQKLETSVGAFLLDLPSTFSDAEAFYVHGTPRDPVYEYLFPEQIYVPEKMDDIAEGFDRLCFCGHTQSCPAYFFAIKLANGITGRPKNAIINMSSVTEKLFATLVRSVSRGTQILVQVTCCWMMGRSHFVGLTMTSIKPSPKSKARDDDFEDFLGDRLREASIAG